MEVSREPVREDTDSSDDDDHKRHHIKQTGKNYVIDLQSFHKTKLRLETELRNTEATNDIVDAYCTDGQPTTVIRRGLSPHTLHKRTRVGWRHPNQLEGKVQDKHSGTTWTTIETHTSNE